VAGVAEQVDPEQIACAVYQVSNFAVPPEPGAGSTERT
jgi:hypothetical protein